MAKVLLTSVRPVTQAKGTNSYFSPASGELSSTSSTEAVRQFTIRTAGVYSNMYVRITAHTNTVNSTMTFRKNNADGNQTITLTAGATGEFEDTTNTDTVADGDEVSTKIVTGNGGAGETVVYSVMAWVFKSNTDTTTIFQHTRGNLADDSITYVYSLTDATFQTVANENRTYSNSPTAGTWDNLYIYATSNTRTTNTIWGSRVNGVNGSQVVTFGSSVSGILEDTTNQDTIVAGDILNYYVTTSTGGGTFGSRYTKSEFHTTDSTWFTAGIIQMITAASGVLYTGLAFSDFYTEGNTETDQQTKAKFAFTASDLWVYCSARTSGTTTAVLRKNAGDTALTVAINATGEFLDTTNDVSIVATDELNLAYTSTGVLTLRGYSMMGTTIAVPATMTGVGSIQGVQTLTF